MDLMNWAVIYSDVPEDKRDVLITNVTDFIGILSEEADDLDLLCNMAPEAVVVYENVEKDGTFEKLYEKLNKEHPEVMYVVQVMMNKAKQDEIFSRMMASKYGLILQVFSVEEALNGFKFENPEAAFEQFCSHIENRLTKMMEEENSGLDLTVYFDIDLVDRQLTSKSKNEEKILKLLEYKLQKLDLKSVLTTEAYESSLLVTGYPVEWNSFKVAGIFSNFPVEDVAAADIISLKLEDNNKYVLLPLIEDVRNAVSKLIPIINAC
ncbi:Hypothetical protein SRAE_2000163600 [Strongyloides ratti]|uniref:Uncharacterized protein n=1 Tax=Strongyloides ratti TaxID=34506 RepID=A0A090LHI1_STRRB|nr:Hypothetical protein SRAE_2000163600 [Strongyloides ratti]CEF66970.1 Hypothetical protein SRAE_2000163600 [Strongyloides ratti]